MRIPVDMSTSAQNSEFSIFKFGDQEIRVIDKDGQPWFIVIDLARTLGYRDTNDALRLLDVDEADTHNLRVRSKAETQQVRKFRIVNESGMYALVLKSRKPEAKPFRRWVTSEVLPSIRKNGSYVKPGTILHSKFPHVHFEPMPAGSVCFTPDEIELLQTIVYYYRYLFKDCQQATYDILEKVRSPLSGKYWEMLHDTSLLRLEDKLQRLGYPMETFPCYRSFMNLPKLS